MKHRDIDRGWAWVVLFGSVCGQIITGMNGVSVGIFQSQYLLHFSETSNTLISLVASIFISLQLTMGPVSGALCNIFGIRATMIAGATIGSVGLFLASFATSVSYLLAAYSVVAGIGFGISYTPLNIAQGHYFNRKRSIANGITTAACGIGLSIGSTMTVSIVESYGWRFALSLLAAISLHMVVIGSAYFPLERQKGCCLRPTQKVQSKPEKVRKESRLWFLRDPNWWILCTSYGVSMVGFAIHLVHFPSYALSCGVTKGELSTLMAMFGIVLSMSRLLGGFFCNDSSVDLLVFMFSTQGIYGILVMLMPFYAKTYTSLMFFQVSMSIFYSASMVPITPLSVQLFGVNKLATVFGWIMMWGGMGYLVGPIIAGMIFDTTGSYALGFHAGGMAVTASAFILLLIPVIKVKVKGNEQDSTENLKSLIHQDVSVTVEFKTDISKC